MINKKKRLRSKADVIWYNLLLKKKCEVCSKPAIQVHHFFPKSLYGHLRYDLENGITLCQGCHFTHHMKDDPVISQTIIKKRGTKWLARLTKKALNSPGGSYLTILYYENTIQRLKEAQDG